MKNNELAHETDSMLHQAKRSIDALFGDGYAEKHPSLVGNFMIAMSNNKIAEHLSQISGSLLTQNS
ncbi:hypothetical protein LZT04_00895 [Vibrio fluvialis]|nr:hypothetical protein [Vibrio fluvialis]